MLAVLASCGTNTGNTSSTETGSLNETASQESQKDHKEATPPNEVVLPVNSDTNILIAYFSRVGNTDFPEDVDAVSSASLLRKDGELYGNTQYVAALIQQATGGDLFLIKTEEKYPADYDETDQLGGKENRERSRPALASHVDGMSGYDLIYLGYPNWYYDMPMAVYAFLEEYDLSGKTIIPFVTSGGSGFSKSISEIQNLQPNAEVLTEGYKVTHSKVDGVTLEDIEQWLDSLEISG
jgi:flavodoxin